MHSIKFCQQFKWTLRFSTPQVTLRFCPDSLADYDDEFAVDTAESRFTVPVWARRPPPSLTLPRDLRVGDVLVGNRRVRSIMC